MKFLIDHCISHKLVPIMENLSKRRDHSLVLLRDKFPVNMDDTDWLPVLGQEGGWVVLTKDPAITRLAQNRAAWIQSGVTGFFLDGSWGNLQLWDFSWRLIRWWPVILERAESCAVGAGFIVPSLYNGRLRRVAVKKREMVWERQC